MNITMIELKIKIKVFVNNKINMMTRWIIPIKKENNLIVN
jgi:hypothetical protein